MFLTFLSNPNTKCQIFFFNRLYRMGSWVRYSSVSKLFLNGENSLLNRFFSNSWLDSSTKISFWFYKLRSLWLPFDTKTCRFTVEETRNLNAKVKTSTVYEIKARHWLTVKTKHSPVPKYVSPCVSWFLVSIKSVDRNAPNT